MSRLPRNGPSPVLLALGVLVAVSAVVGIPGTARSVGAAACAEVPGDHIAVVIDFGDAPGAPSGVWARCVPRSASMRNGLQVLRAATDGIGQDASTKICQISGIPATWDAVNCSAPRDGKVSYWAYFRGTSAGWTYSGVGAAGVAADPNIVEGWRFVTLPVSRSTASAPPPRNLPGGASYRWRTVCPAAPPPSSHPGVTTPRSQAPVVPGGDRSPDRGSGPGSGGGGGSATGVPHADEPPGGKGTSTDPGPSTSPDRTTTTSVATSTTSTTIPELEGTAGLRSSETARRLSDAEVAEAAREASDEGRTVGAIVAVGGGSAAVVVALGLVTRRSRRRRADDEDPG